MLSIHSTCAQGRLSVSMTNMNVRFCAILSLSIVVPALAFAQQTPQSLADAELPSLLAIYKDVHSHPELSGHEERTAALITKELGAAGCEVTEHLGKYADPKFKGYGVIGVIRMAMDRPYWCAPTWTR